MDSIKGCSRIRPFLTGEAGAVGGSASPEAGISSCRNGSTLQRRIMDRPMEALFVPLVVGAASLVVLRAPPGGERGTRQGAGRIRTSWNPKESLCLFSQSLARMHFRDKRLPFHFHLLHHDQFSLFACSKSEPCREVDSGKCGSSLAKLTWYKATILERMFRIWSSTLFFLSVPVLWHAFSILYYNFHFIILYI